MKFGVVGIKYIYLLTTKNLIIILWNLNIFKDISEKLMKLGKIRIKNIFILNLLYGTSNLGIIFQTILYFVYITLLTLLFSPTFSPTYSMPSPSDNLTTQEYNEMTANVDFVLEKSRKDFLSFIRTINELIPVGAKIDLAEMGVLTIKKNYSAVIPTIFPLNSLMDCSSILPFKTDRLDPISALFIETIRNPTYANIEMSGTYVNRLYLENMQTLTDPHCTKEIKIEAWKRLIDLIPPALDFQIRNYNHFLGMINYPYKVEDFYEGSIYQIGEMFEHAGMMSAYDPYGHIIPEQEIVQIYLTEDLEKKKIAFIAPSLLHDPWNTVQVDPAPVHEDPFKMDKDDFEENQRILAETKKKFDLAKQEIIQKKLETIQEKVAHAKRNQMLVHAGLIICTGTIIGLGAGIAYHYYKIKYGGI